MRKNKSYQPRLCCCNYIQTGMTSPYDAARVFFHETNWFQFNFDNRAIQLSKYGVELNLQKIPKHKFSIRWTDMSAICEQQVFWYIPRSSQRHATLLPYMDDVCKI